jgi:hypothetical protein
MPIIVEDGSIVANANSYNSVADADAYFALRGNTVWDGLDPTDQKAPFLVLAVDYLQQAFRTRWKGWRANVDQTLDWPRWNVEQIDVSGGYGPFPRFYMPNVVPQEIKSAQLELAVRLNNGDLAPDVERLEASVKVGSIQIVYDNNFSPNTVYPVVERLLKPFVHSTGIMSQVRRA